MPQGGRFMTQRTPTMARGLAPPADRSDLASGRLDALGIAHRAIAVLVLLSLMRFAEPLLVPLAVAAVLWLLAGPVVEALQRRRVPCVLAAAVMSFVVPIFAAAGAVLALPAAFDALASAAASLRRVVGLLAPIASRGGAQGAAAEWLATRLTWNGGAVTAWLEQRAPEAALGALSSLMLLFFLLLGQRSLARRVRLALPDPAAQRRLVQVVDEARRGVVAFVGVMGLMNALLAAATGIGLAAIGLAHPVLWSVVCFALVFVPYLGPIAVALLLLVAGGEAFGSGLTMFAPAAIFLGLHAVEANFLTPWVMGNRLRLGRPALLVAVMVGAWVWGFFGGLLGVPLLIVAAAALRGAPGAALPNALLAAEDSEHAGAPAAATGARVMPLPLGRARGMPDALRTSRPMRIAFVTETYPPEINGVSLTVAAAVGHLRAQGHDVDLIRPRQRHETRGSSHDQPDSEWRSSGYPIPVYPAMRFGFALPATLAERFRRNGAELVHVATEGPLGWAAVAAANRLGLPVTSDFRTNFHQYSKYYRLGWLEPVIGGYLRRLHNRTVRSFAPTRQTCRELGAAGFERVELGGRGVDLERFAPQRRDPQLRVRWGAAADAPVLLHVGRLAAEKNVALALQAFRNAQRLEPSARMVVVGDGPQRRRLEAEFPEALFVGTQTGAELARHYASADLFLFPSLSDTFGNVTLEALASGLPVIAYDVAAASDLVVDGVNGRTVAPGNDAAFVVATCLLTLRHRHLAPMREAARRTAAKLDWPSVLARFEQQLQATIDAHRQHDAVAEACPA